MIFAKREGIQETMQRNWNKTVLERKYIAIVEGEIEPPQGEIRSYLRENAAMQMYSTKDSAEGQLAVTHYKTIKSNTRFSMVEIQLETGRKTRYAYTCTTPGILSLATVSMVHTAILWDEWLYMLRQFASYTPLQNRSSSSSRPFHHALNISSSNRP